MVSQFYGAASVADGGFSIHTIIANSTTVIPNYQQMTVHDTITIQGTLRLIDTAELAVRT